MTPSARRLLLVAMIAAAASCPARAAPLPCATPEFRQFDFWSGSWTVTTPDGRLAGHSRVEPILDGCALLENWEGAQGGAGKSLNIYDATRKVWHQTWVSKGGTLLVLEGGMDGGSMVLQGTQAAATRPVLNRITWTPSTDGSVKQVWDASSDGGKSWTNQFTGLYRRR